MTDTTTITEEDGLVLEITRCFRAPRQRVFDAWSSLEAMKHWFGPENCSVLGGSVNFQVGGRYRLEVQTEDLGPIAVGGEYREISPPEKLAFSWKWQGHEDLCKDEMEVVIKFTALNENETELRLTQTGFPEREVAEHHGQGWNGTFDKLGPRLAAA